MSWFWDVFGAADANPYAPEGDRAADGPAAHSVAAQAPAQHKQPPSGYREAPWTCSDPPLVDTTAELQLQPREGRDEPDSRAAAGGLSGIEGGLVQALPDANAEDIRLDGDMPIVERDGNQPMAKTAARKRCHALPDWEDADSEEEAEEERRREEALQKPDWTPFMSEDATKAAEEASRKMRREEAVSQDTPHPMLESYEKRVLDLRYGSADNGAHHRSVENSSTLALPTADVHNADDSDSDDGARRENEVELPIVIAWHESPGAVWRPGAKSGELTATRRPGIALYHDAHLSMANVDFEAKLKVVEGDKVGLVFRAGHMYYFVLTMDLSNQTLDIRQGNMKYHDLKRMSSEMAPKHISVRAREWVRLRVTCLGTMISIHFNNEQLGQVAAPKVVVYVVLPRVMNKRYRALPLCEQDGQLLVGHAGEDAFLVHHRDEILEVNGVSDDFEEMKKLCRSCDQLRIKLARIEPGHVGIWCCAGGCVKVKDARVTDMTAYDSSLEIGKRLVQLENLRRESERNDKQTASTFAREFSVGAKLKSLNGETKAGSITRSQAPPPEEEDFHDQYNRLTAHGKDESRRVGKRVLGEAKFEAMRNMEQGPAYQQKLLIAKKYYERALEAVSEVEHLKCLKMAFCLENDFEQYDVIPKEDFQKWLDKKEQDSSGQQPSSSTLAIDR